MTAGWIIIIFLVFIGLAMIAYDWKRERDQ